MAVTVISPTADGIIAALLAPFFMSLGFFLWDVRWTSSGGSAFALNLYKCNVGAIGFAIMAATRGFSQSMYETSDVFTVANVGYLVLSSTLGILVGDILWLEALRLLGAKHVIVVDSLKPFIAAILGRVGLGEVLKAPTWGGMVLTVIGVGVVAWEEQRLISNSGNNDKIKNSAFEKIDKTVVTERSLSMGCSDANDILVCASTKYDERGVQNNGVEHSEVSESLPNKHVKICNMSNSVEEKCLSKSSSDTSNQQSPVRVNSSTYSNSGPTPLENTNLKRKNYRRGYVCAIFNVLADSLGLLLTKKYGVGMTTWSINLIRFGFAGVVLFFISMGMKVRQHYSSSSELSQNSNKTEGGNNSNDDPALSIGDIDIDEAQPSTLPLWFELPPLTMKGWLQITAGVGLVTFLCPALSNYALFQIALGLAISLSSIGPLYGLLLEWPFKNKRPTIYGCAGVLLTISGVIILCLWGTS